MTWVRIPDTWHGDPAMLALSDAQQAGFVRILSWCAANRTDGELPAYALPVLRLHARTVDALCEAGLMAKNEPTSEQNASKTKRTWRVLHPERYLFTEAMRDAKRRAGEIGNAHRWGNEPVAPAIAPATVSAIAKVSPSRPVRSSTTRTASNGDTGSSRGGSAPPPRGGAGSAPLSDEEILEIGDRRPSMLDKVPGGITRYMRLRHERGVEVRQAAVAAGHS